MIQEKLKGISEYSKQIDTHVDFVVDKFTKGLDKVVIEIETLLASKYTEDELDKGLLDLTIQLYYVGAELERVGIREDVAKMIKTRVYSQALLSSEKKTVAAKESEAVMESEIDELAYICYNRAYKTMKLKYETGNELLNSIKKVMTRKLSEKELTIRSST